MISPNQALSLSEVPVQRAGSAGGALQTAQRIGSSAGIAVTGSIFYSRLAGDHSFALAFAAGIASVAGFVALALLLAAADARRTRRAADEAQPRGRERPAPSTT